MLLAEIITTFAPQVALIIFASRATSFNATTAAAWCKHHSLSFCHYCDGFTDFTVRAFSYVLTFMFNLYLSESGCLVQCISSGLVYFQRGLLLHLYCCSCTLALRCPLLSLLCHHCCSPVPLITLLSCLCLQRLLSLSFSLHILCPSEGKDRPGVGGNSRNRGEEGINVTQGMEVPEREGHMG